MTQEGILRGIFNQGVQEKDYDYGNRQWNGEWDGY
jgi:hypothetical protein